jgi:glycerophosphoryl diester phosphodiesterase
MKIKQLFTFYRIAILSLVSLCLGGSLSAVEIIGHRGASFDAPENSLSSMKLAWKQNADGIETDIHLSKDGKMVVMHDADTKRTGDRAKKIAECNWSALKDIDIGKWKGEQWKGETIPTLDSFFETIPSEGCIFTEIKVHDTAILVELEKAMNKAMTYSGKKPKQLRLITFHYDMAQAAKEKFPKHPVYWLSDWKKDKTTGAEPNIDDLIQKAKAAKLDGLDLNFHAPIDKAFVKKVHGAGLKLYTWTVDDPEVARAEAKAGVDGITTNRPQFLRDELKKKK